jgi:hypothetical protein
VILWILEKWLKNINYLTGGCGPIWHYYNICTCSGKPAEYMTWIIYRLLIMTISLDEIKREILQYHLMISKEKYYNITWWDQRRNITISLDEIKGEILQYHLIRSMEKYYNITWWDQRRNITISLDEIKEEILQYHLKYFSFDLIKWYCNISPLIWSSDIVIFLLWSHQVIL